ncbi:MULTISPECIES: glycosyltransferase family 2 protein [Cupriavidus]|uniref:Glycosyltransferase family 2 protein n=1 Tax=Cupriavidus oxalaticus TaxID=96344 RepID=A0A4P7L8K3_9BURK|nr:MULTISPECIES: glycosyltransferase family 2 protein [Cupriavidus]MBF6987961.1 glycosyltransferase family 2 protein [Cupriavidus sp. IK-TO18]QBY50059.1 glycosyltransferase family 2 protein [Cupriavidus oxalaticus]
MPQHATPLPAPAPGADAAHRSHLVLIPSYNPGTRLHGTLQAARAAWAPVWVVVDGSTDGSERWLRAEAATDPALRVLTLPTNQGKGAAVLHGIEAAAAEGFTHVLVMDSDGQHPAHLIAEFMALSQREPDAMVLGRPVFDASAPRERVYWRRMSNFWADVETLWAGIGDSLYGFRVYPIAPLRAVMRETRWMRRFDFDPEAAVRLCWRGVRPINVAAPVRYFARGEGGVSHFRYLRDNLLLTGMHLRLLAGCAVRLPVLLWRRLRLAGKAAPRHLR